MDLIGAAGMGLLLTFRPLAADVTPVRVGDEIGEPARIRHVEPSYPEVAQVNRVQGLIFVEFTVDARGAVAAVRVLRGVPLLDRAAIEAVRQWQYEPLEIDGTAVPFVATAAIVIPSGWLPLGELLSALEDPSEFVRAAAATELGTFGAKAGAALQALREAAGDESPAVRRAATRAVQLIEGR